MTVCLIRAEIFILVIVVSPAPEAVPGMVRVQYIFVQLEKYFDLEIMTLPMINPFQAENNFRK